MQAYLQYKSKITGYQDVAQTVRAMEKIAASHIHFLKQKVSQMNEYEQLLKLIIQRLSDFNIHDHHPLLQPRSTGQRSVVVITGDKGLAGGLWHNIVNYVLNYQTDFHKIFVLGQKGYNYLREEGLDPQLLPGQIAEIPQRFEVGQITDYIFNYFLRQPVQSIDIIYPHFQSVSVQQPLLVNFLPFKFMAPAQYQLDQAAGRQSAGLPIFDSAKREIFNWFVQKYIEIYFFQIIMEARLSEFSSRTLAMENADSKTTALLKKLALDLNKERRRSSTQKQLESFIVHRLV